MALYVICVICACYQNILHISRIYNAGKCKRYNMSLTVNVAAGGATVVDNETVVPTVGQQWFDVDIEEL